MGVVLFFGAFLTTHYVSIGSLLVYAGFMIELVVLGQLGVFEWGRRPDGALHNRSFPDHNGLLEAS